MTYFPFSYDCVLTLAFWQLDWDYRLGIDICVVFVGWFLVPLLSFGLSGQGFWRLMSLQVQSGIFPGLFVVLGSCVTLVSGINEIFLCF